MAEVRVLIPQSRFTADGQDHDHDPPSFDLCRLHWPAIRDAATHNGYKVIDATGDLRALMADYPAWSIFASDGGRLYASAHLNGSPQGITLDAYLVGHLRAQITAAQAGRVS